MGHRCDVVLIEDDISVSRLILRMLSRGGYACLSAPDGEAGWDLIVKHNPKVILSDWELPGMDGLALCRRVRERPELMTAFFVMVTSFDKAEDRDAALSSGVDDYLIKPVERSTLLARVRVGIRMWEINERLRRAAITDGLTGLYNHDHLNRVIQRELNRSRRYGGRLALIMLDLDYFKAINDTYGHLVGNAALVAVARILSEQVREFDTVGRFGGEEFVVVAPEATTEDAVAISERIRLGISDTLQVEALSDHELTASLGIATVDDMRVHSAADLVDLADRALYAAKRMGRNRVVTAFDLPDTDDGNVGIEHQEIECLRKRVAVLSAQAKGVYIQTISSLLQALEEKDPYTARHSANVSFYSEQIARAMGLGEALTATIRNAGLLHDVGKVGIPDRVLMKPGALTDIEHVIMQQVPGISVRIIDHLRILESEMHIIRHQGERYDGSGYPGGLRGEQIPIGSRVLLVANAFDAMTTDRVYRLRRTTAEAMAEIRNLAGRQFDPRAVHALSGWVRARHDEVQARINDAAESVRLPASAISTR